MARKSIYRGWVVCASVVSILSGVWLWVTGERPFGAFGIAAGLFHALWGLDLRAWSRRRG
jgi:hypothetical protein